MVKPMGFIARKTRVLERSIRNIERILVYIGMVMMAALMFLGTADVIGRYVFSSPIAGTAEISGPLMGGVIFLGWAYVQGMRGHIEVDLISNHYSPRVKAITNFVAMLLSLLLFSVIVWKAASIAIIDWQVGMELNIVHIPLAPFELLVPLGAFFLCFELIIQIVHIFPEMVRRRWG
jgi:C4-dicarboxylate transporter DctQ subunit